MLNIANLYGHLNMKKECFEIYEGYLNEQKDKI